MYFTHDLDKDKQNVAPAAGVLHLHKSELKKEFHLNDADFREVCRMIDAEEEPEQGDPLKAEYWQILEQYDSFLQREMYIGDDAEALVEGGTDLAFTEYGQTPLHVARITGYTDLAEYLTTRGADADATMPPAEEVLEAS